MISISTSGYTSEDMEEDREEGSSRPLTAEEGVSVTVSCVHRQLGIAGDTHTECST